MSCSLLHSLPFAVRCVRHARLRVSGLFRPDAVFGSLLNRDLYRTKPDTFRLALPFCPFHGDLVEPINLR